MIFNEYYVFAFCMINAVITIEQSIEDCPVNCRCEPINVVNCSSASINNATFQHIYYKVEYLDLSRNSLKIIPERITSFTEIVSLNLSYNEINFVRRQTFSQMWKLKTLDLSGNNLKSLTDIEAGALFAGNAKLQFLNLSSNPLNNLGDDYDQIMYSETLLGLDVSRCSINHILGTMVLVGLPKVSKLNLSFNPITRLESLSSEYLTSLDVSHCNIQYFRPDSFERLPKLRELYCSSNRHLSDQFHKPVSKSITYIDASFCSIDTNYASELPEVKTVILRGNQLKEIPAYAFKNNSKLEILDLSENLIKIIDEFAFHGADLLKTVDLSHNSVTIIGDNTFAFNSNLVTLNLSRNSLTALNQWRGPAIKILDLSYCELRFIDDKALLLLTSLQALNVSYNFLENLPENWTSLSLLQLDASFCRLTNLNYFNFHRMPSLTEVDLSGNRLVYIRNNTFSAIIKLNKLSLHNNPWKCECYDENFKNLWKNLNILPNIPVVTCMYPENVTGQLWSDACYKDWDTNIRRSKDLIILIVIVIVLLISGIIACVVAIKESLSFRSNRRRENEELENQSEINRRRQSESDRTIQESVRKFTQLPSYDEALLLPKPPSSSSFETSISPRTDQIEKSKKRQSATQTEETIEALLQEIEAAENIEEDRVRRASLQDIEYINIRPLPLQCTEL